MFLLNWWLWAYMQGTIMFEGIEKKNKVSREKCVKGWLSEESKWKEGGEVGKETGQGNGLYTCIHKAP